MRLTIRIHEWLAERYSFIQYPCIKPRTARSVRREIFFRKYWAWLIFAAFWTSVGALSIYGNLIN